MEEDTGRTLHLKDAAFIEDPHHNQVILKGKSYGKEIQTALSSEEFALGTQFCFSQATLADVEKEKRNVPCPRIEKCRKSLMLYASTNKRIV